MYSLYEHTPYVNHHTSSTIHRAPGQTILRQRHVCRRAQSMDPSAACGTDTGVARSSLGARTIPYVILFIFKEHKVAFRKNLRPE